MNRKRPAWARGRMLLATSLLVPTIVAVTMTASSGSASASVNYDINQCANGAIGATPLSCTGSNWQNGDLNYQNSHWSEGDSVPFRAALSGLSSGSHTLVIQYQTVSGNKHAYDYLTSFDATEKTGTATSGLHAGGDNPCDGVLTCDPSSPTVTAPIPKPDFSGVSGVNACGATGTPPDLTGSPGDIKAYGANVTALGPITYESPIDQLSGGGCVTLVDIPFTVADGPAAANAFVIAWGGHIASQLDWGAGQGAGGISGAPYHMWIDGLDGQGGAKERSLQSDAILATPTVGTTIEDPSNSAVTSVPVGTAVHDTATLSGSASKAGGTVTYELFDNGTCAGTPAVVYPAVTVVNGVVPDSPSVTPGAGTYSYLAVYSGDLLDSPASGACEGPLTVTPVTPAFTTAPTQTSAAYGTAVSDTATITGTAAAGVPGGSVSFHLCQVSGPAATCNTGGSPVAMLASTTSGQTMTVTSAAVKEPVGNYCFYASFTSTAGNYNSVGAETNPGEECFGITPAGTSTGTTISSSTVQLGTAGGFYDLVTVSDRSAGAGSPAGTVAFYVCRTGDSAAALQPGPCDSTTGTLVDSAAPVTATGDGATSTGRSSSYTPAGTGTYCFGAYFSGSTNFAASEDNTAAPAVPGECILVTQAPSSVSTTLEGTSGALTGATVSDRATVSGTAGPAPTGTVTFLLYSAPGPLAGTSPCSAQPGAAAFGSPDNDEPLSGVNAGSAPFGPLPAGNYGFQATYSGDGNYQGSTGDCEPFSVGPATPGVSTIPAGVSDARTGASVSDTARVTTTVDGFSPSGTVTFTLYRSSGPMSDTTACSGSAIGSDSAEALSGGSSASTSFGPLAAGNYGFEATFNPTDGNFTAASGNCEPFTIGPATPAVSTVPQVATSGVQTGGSVADSVTVATTVAGGFEPVGTAAVTLYQGSKPFSAESACSTQEGTALGQPVDVAVSGGTASLSSAFGPLQAGSYGFQVTFTSSDGNFTDASGTCEPFTVDPAATSVSTTVVGGDGAATSATVHDTAVVSLPGGAALPFPAGGNVVFTLYSSSESLDPAAACTGTAGPSWTVAVASDGTAKSPPTEALRAGFYGYEVSYGGDPNYLASTDTCEPFSVGKPTTTTTTSVLRGDRSAAPASAQDQATVTPSSGSFTTIAPTGSVTFVLYQSTSPLTAGSTCPDQGAAAYQSPDLEALPATGVVDSAVVNGLPAGNYGWQASFAGDGNYESSEGSCEPFTVLVPPTVSATKADTPGDSVLVNPFDPAADTITYTITLTNTGQIDATGVTLTDRVPTHTSLVSGTATDGGQVDGTGLITWSDLTVPAGGQRTESFSVSVDLPGAGADLNGLSIPNAATFTVPDGDVADPGQGGSCTSSTSCLTNTVANPIDYAVISAAKTAVPAPLPASSGVVDPFDPAHNTVTYTITLTNTGGLGAAVPLSDPIPAGTTLVAVPSGAVLDGTTLTWPGPDGAGLEVPAGGQTSVSFEVTVDRADTNGQVLTNQGTYTVPVGATIGSGCENASTDAEIGTVCDTNQVQHSVAFPVVTAVKSSTPPDGSTVTPGQHVTYTITLSNAGLADAKDVTVTDAVPPGTTFVSAANAGSEVSGTVRWTGVTVPAGNGTTPGSTSVSFVVSVDSTDSNVTIPNVADFTNVDTPSCRASTCPTNEVTLKVPLHQVAATKASTGTTVAPTTTTAARARLAFTGAAVARTVGVAAAAILLGMALILGSRRRRSGN